MTKSKQLVIHLFICDYFLLKVDNVYLVNELSNVLKEGSKTTCLHFKHVSTFTKCC